jgi:hypothetical protein
MTQLFKPLPRRLLTEELTHAESHSSTFLEEDAAGKKSLYLKGIFIQGGVKNHNERLYPLHEIKKAVSFIQGEIDKDISIIGECDHPEELTINLDRVSHVITQMWMDGASGMGKLKILPTPMGNIVRTLIEADVRLGVSSRGVGNVDDAGEVSSSEMITVDIVARPSAPNAYPKPVYESRNARRGRVIDDLAQAVSHDPKAQKHLAREILRWIDTL